MINIQTKKVTKKTNTPFITLRAGGIKATVWKNTITTKTGPIETFNTVLIRSYMDKEQQWQETTQFRVEDLPKVALLTHKVYEYLTMKPYLDEKEEDLDVDDEHSDSE